MKKPDFSKAVVGDIVYYYSKSGGIRKVKVIGVVSDGLYIDSSPWVIKVGLDGIFDKEALPRVFWQPLPEPPEECLKPPKRIRQETRRVWVNVYLDTMMLHLSEEEARGLASEKALAVAVPIDIPYEVEEER